MLKKYFYALARRVVSITLLFLSPLTIACQDNTNNTHDDIQSTILEHTSDVSSDDDLDLDGLDFDELFPDIPEPNIEVPKFEEPTLREKLALFSGLSFEMQKKLIAHHIKTHKLAYGTGILLVILGTATTIYVVKYRD